MTIEEMRRELILEEKRKYATKKANVTRRYKKKQISEFSRRLHIEFLNSECSLRVREIEDLPDKKVKSLHNKLVKKRNKSST